MPTPRAVRCPDDGNLNHDRTTCSKVHRENPPRPPEACYKCQSGWCQEHKPERKQSLPDVFAEIDRKRLELFPKLVAALEDLVNAVDPKIKNGVLLEDYFVEPVEKARALLQEARGER